MRLSWKKLYRQFGVDPSKASDNRTVQDFRKDCLRELKKIKLAWPELNYATAKGVLILSPSKPSIPSVRTASPRKLALRPLLLAQGSLPDGLLCQNRTSLGLPTSRRQRDLSTVAGDPREFSTRFHPTSAPKSSRSHPTTQVVRTSS